MENCVEYPIATWAASTEPPVQAVTWDFRGIIGYGPRSHGALNRPRSSQRQRHQEPPPGDVHLFSASSLPAAWANEPGTTRECKVQEPAPAAALTTASPVSSLIRSTTAPSATVARRSAVSSRLGARRLRGGTGAIAAPPTGEECGCASRAGAPIEVDVRRGRSRQWCRRRGSDGNIPLLAQLGDEDPRVHNPASPGQARPLLHPPESSGSPRGQGWRGSGSASRRSSSEKSTGSRGCARYHSKFARSAAPKSLISTPRTRCTFSTTEVIEGRSSASPK
jgi:hypothetical protein